jgi:hypothetical protein
MGIGTTVTGTVWHSSPVESIVTYRGETWQLVFGALLSVITAVLTTVAALDGNVAAIISAAATALVLWQLSSHCRRVDLHRDGTVVFQYFVRRPLVAQVEDVYKIERHGKSCWIWVQNRIFKLAPDEKVRPLVRELVRRNPSIELSGYTRPTR